MIFRHFMFNLFLLLCSFPSFCLKFCILFYILNLSLFCLYIFNQIFPSFFLLILCFNLFRTFVLRQIPPFFYFLFLQSYELELLFYILLFFLYFFIYFRFWFFDQFFIKFFLVNFFFISLFFWLWIFLFFSFLNYSSPFGPSSELLFFLILL